MNGVQPLLLESLIAFLDGLMSAGKVKINGVDKNYEIYQTIIDGNTIRKFIYIQDEEGLVGEAQLTTIDGEVLAAKQVNIQKEEDGLMLAFEFSIELQGG